MAAAVPFHVRVETSSGSETIALFGELDITAADALDLKTLDDDSGVIRLDLRGLTFIDSAGIHAVLDASDRAKASGRQLILVGASPAVRRVLELGRPLLAKYEDVAGALDVFDRHLRERATPTSPISMTQAVLALDPSDRDLLVGVAEGDPEAFVRLHDRYASTALKLARRILRDEHLADDVVREVYVGVWRDPGRFGADPGTVRSWLMTTVHHRALDRVNVSSRNRGSHDATNGSVLDGPAARGRSTVEELGLIGERSAVRRALGGLLAEELQVVELMYFAGQSQSAVSERLALPLNEVRRLALTGMRRMRSSLSPERS